MYHDGEGVPQSDTMAAQWVERAADLGHAISMYNIGCIYDNGEGVPLDEDIAIRWCVTEPPVARGRRTGALSSSVAAPNSTLSLLPEPCIKKPTAVSLQR